MKNNYYDDILYYRSLIKIIVFREIIQYYEL